MNYYRPPKEKRLITGPSRWSSGRTHRYVYDRLNKMWHVACRDVSQSQPYGQVTTDLEANPVTCLNPGCGPVGGL